MEDYKMAKEMKDIIEELNQIDDKWTKKVVEVDGLEGLYRSDYGDLLNELIEGMRQFIKLDQEKEISDILECLDNKKASEMLIKYAHDTLVHYNNMFALRELEKENKEIVLKLIQETFDCFVLRFDINFIDKYEEYKIETPDVMRRILRSIDCLTEYYVRRLFTRNNIESDFGEETGLTEECCEKYAELVDENFKEIRMNIIMQDGEYIRQTMS